MSDSRELAHTNGNQLAEHQSGNFLAAILEAARDPSIDAAKIEQMANLAMRLQDRERETQFNRDKNAAIMEMPVITKDGRILIRDKDTGREREQGRFARFEDIDRVVRPILQRHNLAISFDVAEKQGGGITVQPILSHTNGYTERGGAMPLPADTSGGKNAVQGVGSSNQYGKRYTMCSMLNIITEGVDDDGNYGRGTDVSLPHEREQLVMSEAKEAFDQGQYGAWYQRQSPKDRAWLVASGKHAEYGGPALPAPNPRPEPDPKPRQERPRPEPAKEESTPKEPEQPKAKLTPAQWADRVVGDINRCNSADQVDELMVRRSDDLVRLKSTDPELHKRIKDAESYRRDAIADGRLV